MDPTPLGDLLDVLSNSYRRELLVALSDHNPQEDDDRDPLNILSDAVEPGSSAIDLFHTHLPKLDSLGYIEWNRDTNEISKGPEWEQIAPVIKLLHDHRDELPAGWL